MAMFMASKIMLGQQSYQKIFSIRMYKHFQEDVNAILIAEGKDDLIVDM